MLNIPNAILIPEMARLIESGHQVEFTPKGTSMRPFIEGGSDSVVLSRANEVRVGDILLCSVGDKYVLHRLIAVDGDQLTLMGDGNLSGKEYCRKADVIGRVIAIRTRSGRRKPLTRGRLWRQMLPYRSFLLKGYRKLFLIFNT